ncbi:MAG: cyclopropane-fatty-acyl-phospholipid synthase family protein [Candidatus Bathyarchaeia archaeon]
METHWTERLFIEHGDLIRREMEKGLKGAEGEVGALLRIFSWEDIPAGGKVLDLCCGIGRHSLLLAGRGYRVFGVDLSPVLISRARELAKTKGIEDRVEFLLGDMRNIREVLKDHVGSFNAVINMNTSLGYYGEEEDEKVLRQLWDLSAPEGVLIIDVGNRDYIIRHFLARDVRETAEGLINVVTRSLDLEGSRMENLYEYYERRGEELRRSATVKIDHRVYSLHELIRLVEKGGWKYLRSFGGFALGPCTIDSNRIILVAKNAQG